MTYSKCYKKKKTTIKNTLSNKTILRIKGDRKISQEIFNKKKLKDFINTKTYLQEMLNGII